MSETFKIKVPTELSGITLKQYQKYIKSVEHDPNKQPTDEQVEFANLKVLECFCGLTLKQAYNTSYDRIYRNTATHIKCI